LQQVLAKDRRRHRLGRWKKGANEKHSVEGVTNPKKHKKARPLAPRQGNPERGGPGEKKRPKKIIR